MIDRSRILAGWPRRLLVVLGALNGIAALGGAWGLVSGVLDLDPTATGRLPQAAPSWRVSPSASSWRCPTAHLPSWR